MIPSFSNINFEKLRDAINNETPASLTNLDFFEIAYEMNKLDSNNQLRFYLKTTVGSTFTELNKYTIKLKNKIIGTLTLTLDKDKKKQILFSLGTINTIEMGEFVIIFLQMVKKLKLETIEV